jgi:hypothetical protein
MPEVQGRILNVIRIVVINERGDDAFILHACEVVNRTVIDD